LWLFNRFKKQKEEARGLLTDPNSWLMKATGGYLTNSGTYINENNVLGIAGVYSCVRIIAWAIAGLPLHTYKRLKPRGKDKAHDFYLYDMLHDNPNPEQTSFEFRSLMATGQLLWGAGVAEIERDPVTGKPKYLWPIPTYCVTPRRTPGMNLLVYEVTGEEPYRPGLKSDGLSRFLWPEDVLVFPAISSTRDSWRSPITTHRETFGLASALKEFGAKTFGQGVNPAGIISVDSPLGEAAEKNLLESLKGYAGLASVHRLMYLNAGVKFERVSLPPQDAQFIESQKFTLAEIARIFNVPLFLLSETEKSTTWGSGIEEINQAFVSYTLNPYLVQWEQEIKKKLFAQEPGYFAEFCVEGLLRGKLLDRYKAYAIGRQHTFLSPDDIRELENKNPLPNGLGERYDTPLNMANVEIADEFLMKDKEEGGSEKEKGIEHE